MLADNLEEGSSVVFYGDPSSHELQLECACVQHEIDHLDGITMFEREFNKTVVNGPKLSRNQKIIISKNLEEKTVKYKKATAFLEDGWTIKEIL